MTLWLPYLLALCAALPQDADRDGLSDFDELHKHRTDPKSADSDGDGKPDGDWLERREFTYVVRALVQVMKPVTPELLAGDYQDARVIDERADRYELEVLLYPFATAREALRGDTGWRRKAGRKELERWLAPGHTSDWDRELRARILKELETDGIDLESLDDEAAVEAASSWLLRRAEYSDGSRRQTSERAPFNRYSRGFRPNAKRR